MKINGDDDDGDDDDDEGDDDLEHEHEHEEDDDYDEYDEYDKYDDSDEYGKYDECADYDEYDVYDDYDEYDESICCRKKSAYGRRSNSLGMDVCCAGALMWLAQGGWRTSMAHFVNVQSPCTRPQIRHTYPPEPLSPLAKMLLASCEPCHIKGNLLVNPTVVDKSRNLEAHDVRNNIRAHALLSSRDPHLWSRNNIEKQLRNVLRSIRR